MLTMRTLAVSDMNLLDAGITALMGYAVVFVGLVLLMAVVTLLGRAMMAGRKEKQAEAQAAPPPPAAPAPKAQEAKGTGGTVLLHDVPEREAAMVMAVVAHRLGTPLNQLRFKSIREVKEK